MADFEANIDVNIPEQLQSNLHYFNLNNQLKYDLEQQNAIKMQQLEAIRLIQISLEKLTATTTVPLHNQTTRAASKTAGNPPPPTILVYKETSLCKNLLVSKILNKAKYLYYQSIVQTMRMSLMSKLNYYSMLIQQLYPSEAAMKLEEDKSSDKKSADEARLIEEMKVLMQQILHDTYQFNSFNNGACAEVNKKTLDDSKQVLKERSSSNLNTPTPSGTSLPEEDTKLEQSKRIKQLNDVKHSLYSLLFPQATTPQTTTTVDKHQLPLKLQLQPPKKESDNKLISQNENVSKRKGVCSTTSTTKRARVDKEEVYCSIDSNNNQVILVDETNVVKEMNEACSTGTGTSNNTTTNKCARKQRNRPHISTKLLKLSLKTATTKKQSGKFSLGTEGFNMNLEVLV